MTALAWRPLSGNTLAVGCRRGVCLWSLGKCPAGGAPSCRATVAGSTTSAWLSFLRTRGCGALRPLSPRNCAAQYQVLAQVLPHPQVPATAAVVPKNRQMHRLGSHCQLSAVVKLTQCSSGWEQCSSGVTSALSQIRREGSAIDVGAGVVTALAWSPDGQLLAASSQDAPGFVIFDVTTGEQTSVQAGKEYMHRHPFSLSDYCTIYCTGIGTSLTSGAAQSCAKDFHHSIYHGSCRTSGHLN